MLAFNRSFPRFRKFLSYYKPYRRLLLADMACALIVSATALALPLCARYITQNLLEESRSDTLRQIVIMGLVMLGLVTIQAGCKLFVDYQGHMMGTLMESDMRADLFSQYQKLSFGFYDNNRTGQLMARITHDLFSISELYHHGPEDLLIVLLKFSGVFIILMHINVTLTLIIFLFLPLMMVYAFYFNKKMNRALLQSRERIGDVNAQVEETLSGIRVVKAFANEPIETQKFAHENARFVDSRRVSNRSEAYFSGGMDVFVHLFTIAVIIFGAISIVRDLLTLADLVTFLLYVGNLVEPIQRAVNSAHWYQEGITGFSRFMDIMEIEPAIQNSADAVELPCVQGHITFNNVSFKYNDVDVIKDITLDIRPGEYVALVGASGAGKSTLCSLIPRFYEVTEGEIQLDGVNIQDICLRSLRHNIGVVQQDVYLFAGTIADNIRYGKLDADMTAVIEAARQANAHDFIMALPDGYDTNIGQRGVRLSGGQKQRLSIARVFLKNPPVIIFDEATSALDNESESAIQAAIETLTTNCTMIIIAHRLSTVRNAQRIVVLTEHGIAEQGTHASLMASEGRYAKLYAMQLRP